MTSYLVSKQFELRSTFVLIFDKFVTKRPYRLTDTNFLCTPTCRHSINIKLLTQFHTEMDKYARKIS